MVEWLERRGYISQPQVKEAMLSVPRHRFVETEPFEAYEDRAVSIKEQNAKVISTISQPSVVAHMLEELEVEDGCKVLEIGSGLGYNAALLGHLCGPHGLVVTIEYDEELAVKAKHLLHPYANVVPVHGDGRQGYALRAPFDRVIATVTAADLYPHWQEQLGCGGLILAPLEYFPGFTRLIKLRKTAKGFFGRLGWAVNFVSMAGGDSKDPSELSAVKRFLAAGDLGQHKTDSFIFFYLCSGLEPEEAMDTWTQLGMPNPENFLISENPQGVFKLCLPSIELGLSLPV